MSASNQQVQQYVNERIRPFCEAVRALKLHADDIKASIDDVYANLTSSPTWTDNRTDGPPHLLTPNDVLAVNAWVTALIVAINTTAGDLRDQYPIIQKACVRPVTG